jgi:membrane protein
LQAADENRVPFLASALTFDALLAAVPLFILLLAGLSWVVRTTGGEVSPTQLVERFFPPHDPRPGLDPFESVEVFLVKLTDVARELSIYAIPAFIWFSTRLFASIRTSLNEIYDLHLRPIRRHFALLWLFGKLRDLAMVGVTLVLFLANTVLTTGLALLEARGRAVGPNYEFLVTTVGRLAGEALAFVFLVSLFFVAYHFASVRRPSARATLLAALLSAVLFEAAKRLFAIYLRNAVSLQQVAVDVNVGAAFLFVLWMYYGAVVFLLGAVVAETWELREMQRRQRV